MSTQPKPYITPEQYLEIERKAEYKSEYYRGEMFPLYPGETILDMAGAQRPHNLLATHMSGELYMQLRSRPCEIYGSDMRIRVNETGLFTYADVVVVCGQPEILDNHVDVLLNPTVIVEVLSPSTAAYNRGGKFKQYKTIPSFQQYVLVASDCVYVDVFTRQPDGSWLLRSATKLDESIELESIGCRVAMADLYNKVELPENPPLHA
jgi:Uma2 family endonuclease